MATNRNLSGYIGIMSVLNRKKTFLQGLVSNYFAVAVTIIVNLISVPIGLHYFGPVAFSIWLIITSILGYLRMCDLGIGAATSTLIAQNTDSNIHRAILGRSVYIVTVLSLVLIIVTIIITHLFPSWGSILGKIPLNLQKDASSALLAIVILTLFQLPMTIFSSAFSGLQQVHWNRLYVALYSVVNLVALIITVMAKGNLTSLAIFTGTGNILVGVISGGHLFFSNRHVWPRVTEKINDAPTTNFILLSGFRFLLLQIAAIVISNTDNLIISHFLGIENVTRYAISFKFFYMFLTLINGSIVALWPMYGQAFGRRDWNWIQKTYTNITLLLSIAGAVVWIGGIVFSEPIIKLWVGHSGYGGLLVAFALGGYVYLSSYTGSNVSLANALNPTCIVVVFGFVEALLNLILSISLVTSIGIGGVALGTFVAAFATNFWFYPLYIRYRTSKQVSIKIKPIVTNGFFVILCVLLALFVVLYIPMGLARYIAGLVIIGIYLTISWRVLPHDTRNLIMTKTNLMNIRVLYGR
jgi:O-antigen/teichoic acid export membrane protein